LGLFPVAAEDDEVISIINPIKFLMFCSPYNLQDPNLAFMREKVPN
jgi:hypothetical protein